MTAASPPVRRPHSVIAALIVMGAVLAIGIAGLPSIVDDLPFTLPGLFLVLLQAAVFYSLFRGRNWGRIFMAATAFLAAIYAGFQAAAAQAIADAPAGAAFKPLLFAAAQLAALALLFIPASNAYFRQSDPKDPVETRKAMFFLNLLLALFGAFAGMQPAIHHKFTGPSPDTAFNIGQFEMLFFPAVLLADVVVAIFIARKKLAFRRQCGIAFASGLAPHLLASIAVIL